jgi:hypothetical protein
MLVFLHPLPSFAPLQSPLPLPVQPSFSLVAASASDGVFVGAALLLVPFVLSAPSFCWMCSACSALLFVPSGMLQSLLADSLGSRAVLIFSFVSLSLFFTRFFLTLPVLRLWYSSRFITLHELAARGSLR